MNERTLAFLYAPELDKLSYPDDCPFKTQRLGLTRQRLLYLGLLGGPGRLELAPRPATRAELEAIHTPRYLDELQRAAAGDLTVAGVQMGLGGPDTPVFKDMYAWGAWACGGALVAAECLLAGRADIVFNLAGGFHHAFPEQAGGFCYLNDVALACQRLAAAGKRVAYVDIDAHHGNGVQEVFYRRKDVLTISLHETGRTLYPWSGFENEIGEGPGTGFNVNVPLPPETYDEAFLRAYRGIVPPLLRAYNPDVIVTEMGMDILAGDPLTHLSLTNNVVAEIARQLLSFGRPLLVAGGGGYNVEHTVRGWTLAWHTFANDEDEDVFSLGIGGVLMGSSEWVGGLRDRQLPVPTDRRQRVDTELDATLRTLRQTIFKHHGLETLPADAAGPPADGQSPAESGCPSSLKSHTTT